MVLKGLNKIRRGGFTLVEAAVSMFVIGLVGVGVSSTLAYTLQSVNDSTERALAMEAAIQEMETVRSVVFTNFTAYFPGGVAGTTLRSGFLINSMPDQIQGGAPIRRAMGLTEFVTRTSTPDSILVRVTVCYRSVNRIYGEDQNLDGNLDAGEDANANGIMDSPVQLTSVFVRK